MISVSQGDSPPSPVLGWGDAVALTVWTLAVLTGFFQAATLQESFFYFDVTELNYPYRSFLADEIAQGRWSRWHPGLYNGLPLFAESQAGYFHPFKPLLYGWSFLPTWAAFNLDVIGSIWLTGLATYGWLRRRVGPPAALGGAAVFALGGYLWAHLVHTSMVNAMISLPLAVWALEWGWSESPSNPHQGKRHWIDGSRRARWGMTLAALAIAAQVFCGHNQDVVLTAGLLGLIGLWNTLAWRRATPLLMTGGAVVLGLTLASVQWIPSKELLDRSPRAEGLTYEQVTYGSWHPELWPTVIWREAHGTRAVDTDWMDGYYPYHEMNAYVGLTVFALAILGLADRRRRWGGLWPLVVGLGVLLMLGRFTALYDVLWRVSVLGRIPARFDLWVQFALAALTALGIEHLARTGSVKPPRLRWAVLATILGIIAAVGLMIWSYQPLWSNPDRFGSEAQKLRTRWLYAELAWSGGRTLILAIVGWWLIVTAARAGEGWRRRAAVAALPVVILADLLSAHWYDAPTIDPSYWSDPPPTARAILADPAHQRVFGVAGVAPSGPPGHAAPRFDPNAPALDLASIRDPLSWSLPPLFGLRSNSGITPIIPLRKHLFEEATRGKPWGLDLEGVSHVVTDLTPTTPGWSRVANCYLWKNETVLPRVRLIERVAYADSMEEALTKLNALGPQTRIRVVVEDRSRPLPLDPAEEHQGGTPGDVEVVAEEPERLVVRVKAARPAYLVVADAHDPGWSATLDGLPVPILPAYVAQRAIFVPQGSHEVVMTYEPAHWRLGLRLTRFGVLVSVGLLVWPWPRRAPGRKGNGRLSESSNVVATVPSQTFDPELEPMTRGASRFAAGMLLVILVGSLVTWRDGTPAIQERWSGSWHRFTWGAGIDAIGKVGVGR